MQRHTQHAERDVPQRLYSLLSMTEGRRFSTQKRTNYRNVIALLFFCTVTLYGAVAFVRNLSTVYRRVPSFFQYATVEARWGVANNTDERIPTFMFGQPANLFKTAEAKIMSTSAAEESPIPVKAIGQIGGVGIIPGEATGQSEKLNVTQVKATGQSGTLHPIRVKAAGQTEEPHLIPVDATGQSGEMRPLPMKAAGQWRKLNPIPIDAGGQPQGLHLTAVEGPGQLRDMNPIAFKGAVPSEGLSPTSANEDGKAEDLNRIPVKGAGQWRKLDPIAMEGVRQSEELYPIPVNTYGQGEDLNHIPVKDAGQRRKLDPIAMEGARQSEELHPIPVNTYGQEEGLNRIPVKDADQWQELHLISVNADGQSRELHTNPMDITSPSEELNRNPVKVAGKLGEVHLIPVIAADQSEEMNPIPVKAAGQSEESHLIPVDAFDQSEEFHFVPANTADHAQDLKPMPVGAADHLMEEKPILVGATDQSVGININLAPKVSLIESNDDESALTPTDENMGATSKQWKTESEDVVNATMNSLASKGECVEGWRSMTCYKGVVRLARQRQVSNTVVLVVIARGDYDVVLNWCLSTQRLGLDNYMLVALDEESHGFFSQLGAPVTSLPRGSGETEVKKSDVWIRRTLAAYVVLNEGIDVLISDADAVMMKSPFARWQSHFYDKTLDIITSPSNFPNPAKGELPEACPSPGPGKMEWRHWPCMGWILLRSSKQMREFFEDNFIREVLRYKDDQIAFNCAVRRAGAEWEENMNWGTDTAMRISSKYPQLDLLVLPASQFVRNCTEFEKDRKNGYGISNFEADAVDMYHCKGYHKKENAVNNGFWYIKEDWEMVSTKEPLSFFSYLELISINEMGRTR